MLTKIIGKITSLFPDDINTDDIIPAWTLSEADNRSYFKTYAFQNYYPSFVKICEKGGNNIIVAGKNFGTGSSREQAIYALQENGVVAVIAQSFPDIFYRNALNNGLILIALNNLKPFKISNYLTIDLLKRTIRVNDKIIKFRMSEEDVKTFAIGGKIGKVKKHLEEIISNKTKKHL